MTDTLTTELTGTQKAAIVLMSLDKAQATELLKQFSDEEASEITAEIIRMRKLDPATAEAAINEFHDMATTGRVPTRGGRDIATGLLESAFGSERAAGVLHRVASSMAGKAFEFLDEVEPGQIITLLDGEHPQTAALVLAHLKPGHSAKVLAGLPDDRRTDVSRRIATMTSASPDTLSLIAAALKERSAAVVAPRNQVEVIGGVQPLVDIINRSDATTEKAVLEGLDEVDPDLAAEVRSRMLTFTDIVKLDDKDVQQVLRGINTNTLAVALKGVNDQVNAKIRDNLSERNRELLDDEINVLGRVRQSHVEEARADVVRSIRELAESGGITVHRNDEDGYVD
jgi:flagellar motor switch protein FliG